MIIIKIIRLTNERWRIIIYVQSFALAGKPTDANLVYYNISRKAYA